MASISPLMQPKYLAATADTTTNTSGGNAAPTTDLVSKDEFLKLLVAQLQNQDPLNPLQGDAFVAQLATFSSLEQLVSINSNIEKLVNTITPPPNADSTQN
jgi:flagellar basal-body rod modification protein FlgD